MRTAFIPVAGLVLALATPAFAQSGTTPLAAKDQQYLRQTAQGADYELAISKLALQKSQRSDIRGYAQHIVTDHEQANGKLQQVAMQNGVQLPTGMTTAQQAEYAKLQGLSGHAFDSAYVAAVKSINQNDSSQFSSETAELSSPQLKSMAQDMHKTDEKHAQEAQTLKP